MEEAIRLASCVDIDSIASMRLIRYIDGERGLYAQQVTLMSGLLVQAIANVIARALLSTFIAINLS